MQCCPAAVVLHCQVTAVSRGGDPYRKDCWKFTKSCDLIGSVRMRSFAEKNCNWVVHWPCSAWFLRCCFWLAVCLWSLKWLVYQSCEADSSSSGLTRGGCWRKLIVVNSTEWVLYFIVFLNRKSYLNKRLKLCSRRNIRCSVLFAFCLSRILMWRNPTSLE